MSRKSKKPTEKSQQIDIALAVLTVCRRQCGETSAMSEKDIAEVCGVNHRSIHFIVARALGKLGLALPAVKGPSGAPLGEELCHAVFSRVPPREITDLAENPYRSGQSTGRPRVRRGKRYRGLPIHETSLS